MRTIVAAQHMLRQLKLFQIPCTNVPFRLRNAIISCVIGVLERAVTELCGKRTPTFVGSVFEKSPSPVAKVVDETNTDTARGQRAGSSTAFLPFISA